MTEQTEEPEKTQDTQAAEPAEEKPGLPKWSPGPQGGQKTGGLMLGIFIVMGALIGLAVLVSMLREDGEQVDAERQAERSVVRAAGQASRVEEERAERTIVGYGERVQGRSVAAQVDRSFKTNRVGNRELGQEAAQDAAFVVVEFSYLNTSGAPLRSLNEPEIQLVGPGATVYSTQRAATDIYTAANDLSGHALSDFNPGITFEGAAVFEIAESRLREEGWMVKVKAGGTIFFAPLDI